MERLQTSKRVSRVFRGLVLVLAMVLVACGSDSDKPEPTATSAGGQEQEALPTVPPVESTPESSVSEEEITVLEPEIPATADASTPDATEEVVGANVNQDDTESSAVSTPSESTSDVDAVSSEANDEEIGVASETETDAQTAGSASPEASPSDDDVSDLETVTTDATASVNSEEVAMATVETSDPVSTPGSTEAAGSEGETFNNPGDGTGGSGMPGERDSNEEPVDSPVASPEASPIAQLTISGCEVPDVPGFLGESNVFVLTADVNFRSGPGVDCDPVIEEPIGEGQIVLVSGGPVTQADDGTEWVQIDVNGESGWITNEFLEPAE